MKPYFKRRDGKPRAPQQQRDAGNRVYDSTSTKGKIRGTARQLVERHLQFAEEARLANDRVASEAFLQSAEHYIRIGKPVPVTENEPVTATCPERVAIAAMERSISKKVSVPSARTVPASEPESITVTEKAKRQDANVLRQASVAAKRAAAAAKVEQVALQHGYTLTQLGLALESE